MVLIRGTPMRSKSLKYKILNSYKDQVKRLKWREKKILRNMIRKNGSETEKAGLHLYTKHHEALMLQKMFTIDY
jgi:hypothetical protein